jgi:uncharacterized membrane protein
MAKSKEIKNSDTKSLDDNQDQYTEIEKVVSLLHQQIQHFSGPLPSPEMLSKYNEILPNAAERVFRMAEKAQDHYEETEKKLVDLEIKKVPKGQNHAFAIAITGIVGAVICAFLGQVTIGSIIGGATLISVVPHFIPGKRKKKEDNDYQLKLEQMLREPVKTKSK